MPNWCETTYKCIGDKNELKEFRRILNNNRRRKTSRVENGFGTLWLGNIIDNFGFDWNNYRCRGEIIDYYMEDGMLVIYQNTAWCEQEGFRQAIKEKFPSIDVFYQEVEPGCGVYCTNSFEVFPEKYIVDSKYETDSFNTFEEMLNFVSKLLNRPLSCTEKELEEIIDKYNEEASEENHIFINTFELLN